MSLFKNLRRIYKQNGKNTGYEKNESINQKPKMKKLILKE